MERVTVSERARLQQLLTQEELGDRRPSQLLRSMQRLMGDMRPDDSIIRELFLSRLPSSIQAILACSPDLPLDKLAQMADRAMEAVPARTVAAVTSDPTTSALLQRIEQLSEQVKKLSRQSRERWRRRSNSRSDNASKREASASPNRATTEEGVCWYHNKFAEKAHKCTTPCSYQGN